MKGGERPRRRRQLSNARTPSEKKGERASGTNPHRTRGNRRNKSPQRGFMPTMKNEKEEEKKLETRMEKNFKRKKNLFFLFSQLSPF